MTKMAKIDTLFMTKTAEKPYPLGHTYIAHIREYPPPWDLPQGKFAQGTISPLFISFPEPRHFIKLFNKTLSPAELANDFQILRQILKSNPLFGSFLVGPDVSKILSNHTRRASFLER